MTSATKDAPERWSGDWPSLPERSRDFPATSIHLIALKALARDDDQRPQDLADLRSLLRVADAAELARARTAVALIEERGFHRGRRLVEELEALIAQVAAPT